MYDKGYGVTQDYVQSLMWFNIGAINRHEKARKYRAYPVVTHTHYI